MDDKDHSKISESGLEKKAGGRNEGQVESCLGHIGVRLCDWCEGCTSDYITGNNRNKECPYYTSINLRVLNIQGYS